MALALLGASKRFDMIADNDGTPDDADVMEYSFSIKDDGRLSLVFTRDLSLGWIQAFFEALPSEFHEAHEPECPQQANLTYRSLRMRNAHDLSDDAKVDLIRTLRSAAGRVNAWVRAGEVAEPDLSEPNVPMCTPWDCRP